jgi:hypothetical protein
MLQLIKESRVVLELLNSGESAIALKIDAMINGIKENKKYNDSFLDQILDELLWRFENCNYDESEIYLKIMNFKGY